MSVSLDSLPIVMMMLCSVSLPTIQTRRRKGKLNRKSITSSLRVDSGLDSAVSSHHSDSDRANSSNHNERSSGRGSSRRGSKGSQSNSRKVRRSRKSKYKGSKSRKGSKKESRARPIVSRKRKRSVSPAESSVPLQPEKYLKLDPDDVNALIAVPIGRDGRDVLIKMLSAKSRKGGRIQLKLAHEIVAEVEMVGGDKRFIFRHPGRVCLTC